MDINKLLEKTIEKKASDLHISVGYPPVFRINGKLKSDDDEILTPETNEKIMKELLNEKEFKFLNDNGEIDISYSQQGIGRFRINIFKQRGTYGAAIRAVSLDVPSIEYLGLPSLVEDLTNKKRGLILVTGPTGSGKSTTLASMIKRINETRREHILTLEDPIEYLHRHNKSIVNQREIGTDSNSFSKALKSALRQDPDVILVGEMRDLDTISTAITAAETGHLVLSTLHTIGADKTVDRIIDVFPPHQQQQIRIQLSNVLEGVISQQLLSKNDGSGRVLAVESMVLTPAIQNLIREGKTHQIQTAIQTGKKYGMENMDSSLAKLYKEGIISKESLETYATNKETIKKYISY